MKYKIVCRYYGDADLKQYNSSTKKLVDVPVLVSSRNIIIVSFPTPIESSGDYIGIYEIVPCEEIANE